MSLKKKIIYKIPNAIWRGYEHAFKPATEPVISARFLLVSAHTSLSIELNLRRHRLLKGMGWFQHELHIFKKCLHVIVWWLWLMSIQLTWFWISLRTEGRSSNSMRATCLKQLYKDFIERCSKDPEYPILLIDTAGIFMHCLWLWLLLVSAGKNGHWRRCRKTIANYDRRNARLW